MSDSLAPVILASRALHVACDSTHMPSKHAMGLAASVHEHPDEGMVTDPDELLEEDELDASICAFC